MLTRTTRIKLLVFALIAALVIAIVSVFYIQLPQLFGFEQYRVTADFADASGIYKNAIVTYRGVDVGKVRAVRLESTGADVVLSINNGTKVPADSRAEIHSTSAIGEQYVDLVPKTGATDGSLLRNGMTIPRADTVELPSTDRLITKLNALVAALPKRDLGATLDEIATSFGGAGPDLQRLTDSASQLLATAERNVGPTTRLMRDLGPFLHTQQDVASETTSTVTNLASFTHQLVLSNGDIVSLLHETPSLARGVTGTERDLTPTLKILLSNLTTTGKTLVVYDAGVREILAVYPALVAGLIDFAQSAETTKVIPLDFHLNVDLPPRCIKGFLPASQRRDPSVLTSKSTPSGLYCKVASSAPPSVRGTRNLPCLNNPGVRASTPAACLGISQAAAEARYDKVATASSTSSGSTAVTYSRTGKVLSPGGKFYLVGDSSPANETESTWQDLLLGPIGK